MSMPTVTSFCGYVSLGKATTIFAPVCSFVDKITAFVFYYGHFAYYVKNDSTFPILLMYVIMAICLITTLLMSIGAALDKRKLMIPFLILSIMDFHVTTIITWCAIVRIYYDSIGLFFVALIFGNSAIAFAVYYWITVYSRFMQIIPEDNENLIENGENPI